MGEKKFIHLVREKNYEIIHEESCVKQPIHMDTNHFISQVFIKAKAIIEGKEYKMENQVSLDWKKIIKK